MSLTVNFEHISRVEFSITQRQYYSFDSAISFTETIMFTMFSPRQSFFLQVPHIKHYKLFAERFIRI